MSSIISQDVVCDPQQRFLSCSISEGAKKYIVASLVASVVLFSLSMAGVAIASGAVAGGGIHVLGLGLSVGSAWLFGTVSSVLGACLFFDRSRKGNPVGASVETQTVDTLLRGAEVQISNPRSEVGIQTSPDEVEIPSDTTMQLRGEISSLASEDVSRRMRSLPWSIVSQLLNSIPREIIGKYIGTHDPQVLQSIDVLQLDSLFQSKETVLVPSSRLLSDEERQKAFISMGTLKSHPSDRELLKLLSKKALLHYLDQGFMSQQLINSLEAFLTGEKPKTERTKDKGLYVIRDTIHILENNPGQLQGEIDTSRTGQANIENDNTLRRRRSA